MKKILLPLLIVLLAFSACEKKGDVGKVRYSENFIKEVNELKTNSGSEALMAAENASRVYREIIFALVDKSSHPEQRPMFETMLTQFGEIDRNCKVIEKEADVLMQNVLNAKMRESDLKNDLAKINKSLKDLRDSRSQQTDEMLRLLNEQTGLNVKREYVNTAGEIVR